MLPPSPASFSSSLKRNFNYIAIHFICMHAHMWWWEQLAVWVLGTELGSSGLAALPSAAEPSTGPTFSRFIPNNTASLINIHKKIFLRKMLRVREQLYSLSYWLFWDMGTIRATPLLGFVPSSLRTCSPLLRQKHTHIRSLGITRENEGPREKFPKTGIHPHRR